MLPHAGGEESEEAVIVASHVFRSLTCVEFGCLPPGLASCSRVPREYVSFAPSCRVVTPARDVSTIAGDPGHHGFMDGVGAAARFHRPSGIVLDAAGDIIVADFLSHCLRKVHAKLKPCKRGRSSLLRSSAFCPSVSSVPGRCGVTPAHAPGAIGPRARDGVHPPVPHPRAAGAPCARWWAQNGGPVWCRWHVRGPGQSPCSTGSRGPCIASCRRRLMCGQCSTRGGWYGLPFRCPVPVGVSAPVDGHCPHLAYGPEHAPCTSLGLMPVRASLFCGFRADSHLAPGGRRPFIASGRDVALISIGWGAAAR